MHTRAYPLGSGLGLIVAVPELACSATSPAEHLHTQANNEYILMARVEDATAANSSTRQPLRMAVASPHLETTRL